MSFKPIALTTAILIAVVASNPIASAQTTAETSAQEPTRQEKAREVAQRVDLLMQTMQTQAEGYPDTLERLRLGQETIQKADETVSEMIDRLKTMADEMEDESEFAVSIDAFENEAQQLIAEAEASNNAKIKELLPTLTEDRDSLRDSDQRRSRTVVEARNLIRDLEDNRSTIAFYIKANALSEAADLIAASVTDFEGIVAEGRQLADELIEASNP